MRCHASYYTQMVKSLRRRRRIRPQRLNPSSDNHTGSYDLPGESAGTMVDALLRGSVTCVDNFLGTSGGHPLGNRTRPKTSSKNMQLASPRVSSVLPRGSCGASSSGKERFGYRINGIGRLLALRQVRATSATGLTVWWCKQFP